MPEKLLPVMIIAAIATFCACAERTSAAGHSQTAASAPAVCPVDVMEPTSAADAFQGNVAGHAPEVTKTVAARILAVARESCANVRLVDRLEGNPLIVPHIVQWKQMRTDDPIGTFILPHNSVVITLRLMGTKGPINGRTLTFKHQARLTLNQSAERLLDENFNKTIRRLLSSAAP